MRRSLTITTVCAIATGALASPALAGPDRSALVETAQSRPVAVNAGNVHSVIGQAGITKGGKLPSIRIVGAVPASATTSVKLAKVCGTGKDSHELVTRSGRGSSCRSAVKLMCGWRHANNPRRYHGFRCGDVPGANVDFARGDRWFASWQCSDKTATYRVWTRY